MTIDHINGIKDDNRIKNLRASDKNSNSQNRPSHRNGLPIGVTYNHPHYSKKHLNLKNRWVARAPKVYLKRISNSQKYIGSYATLEAAKKAVIAYCTDGTILNLKGMKNPS
jgi:hypothetical protein